MTTRIRWVFALSILVLSVFSVDVFGAAGRTEGQFTVSSRGSAQYSIPLWVPPGIRGIQPTLALTYDSQLGYGLMGPGWTINGLSVIARCNKTYAQDGAPAPITLTTADGLCLDGNRLRTTSTGVYQTEIANFSQVTASGTAGNGPSYFTVEGKDGLTYEYGDTTDSQILPTGSTTPYIWALDKVTDRSGNSMTFTYYQAGGSYVPLSIQYTAPSGSTTFPYKVNFKYSNKSASDTINKFVAGSQIQQTQQLSTVTVTNAGTTVREYKLLYTTSSATLRATLTSIQECGGSAGTDCLPATSVGYQYGTAGVASPATASGSGATNGTVYSVDIDGDGRQDLVFAVTSGSNYKWYVQFATASGYGAPISTGAVTVGTTDFLLDDFNATGATDILAPVGGIWYVYQWNGASFTATSTNVAVVSGAIYSSVDADGDGRPDLIYVLPSPNLGNSTLGIRLNTSSAGSVSFATTAVVQTLPVSNCCIGDTRLYGNNQFPNSSLHHFYYEGGGRQDLILYYYTESGRNPHYTMVPILPRSTGTPAFGFEYGLGPTAAIFAPVNWNDDDCTDLLLPGVVSVSGCDGTLPFSVSLPATATLALDWDGDGRTDVLADVSGTWELYRSEGNAVAPSVSTGISAGSGTWIITDKNGDGLSDLAFAKATASNAIYYGLHNGTGVHPDLATSFDDGYGNSVDPTYVSIVQSDYTAYAYANPVYPYENFLAPLYVVNKATSSDPSNAPSGTYYQTFSYSGAWTNVQGRGFSNFLSRQTYDSRNGLWETDYRSNEFPWQDLLTGVTVAQDEANTKPISQMEVNDLTFITLDGTTNNERYFPYYGIKTTFNYELGGSENTALISTANINYTYDNYGNATTVATTVTDNDPQSPYSGDTWTSTLVNTIAPDTGTWCLNVPAETTVTNSSSASNGGAITRTITYTPDYTNCRETQKIIEPNSATYKVTEAYGYDSFGNLHTDTVTGVGMTPRVTTVTWNSTGQFPQTIKNALGQSITLGFDPNTGMKTSQTDPNYTSSNPLTTTWGYDDFARQTSELRPDGTSTSIAYNLCGAGCVNSNNKMTATRTVLNVGGGTQSVQNIYLDSLDRPLVSSSLMLNGAYDRNEVQYDDLGRVQERGAPCTFVSCVNYWTTNTYDALNRLTKSQRPISATNGTLQTTMIQYAGRTTTVTDPQAKNTIRINLVTGRLARTQDHNGYYVNFNYDAFGSLLSVKDSLSNTLNTMTYDYGLQAFQRTSSDADLGPRSNTYDALGELIAYTDANRNSFNLIYDALSRPTNRTEPDLTTTWGWGNTAASYNIGKLQSVSSVNISGTYSESFGYDSKTRPSTKTIVIPGDTSYTYTTTYNATTGLLDTLQYPASTGTTPLKLHYAYTNGILEEISDFNAGTAYWIANTANPRGQFTKETLGNGVVVSHVFDAVTGWVDSIQAGKGGGTGLQNNAYAFDEMGNLIQRQDNTQGLTENAYYDNLYRLDHTTLNGVVNDQYAYDVTGNVTQWAVFGALPANVMDYTTPQSGCTYYANSQPHAVRSQTNGSSVYSYCYDANGNTVSSGGSIFSWTSYNMPDYFNNGAFGASQFYYNADHQRYKQVATGYPSSPETTYYVGNLMQKIATPAATTYRHLIQAGSTTVLVERLSTGTNPIYYITKDHLGSTSVISDVNGALVLSENFSPTGLLRSSNWAAFGGDAGLSGTSFITHQGFTGQETDDNISLVNLNGRMLQGSGGRMTSPDPFVSNPGNTQGFNRYSYVNNNPLSDTDPSGFFNLGSLLNPFANDNPLNPFGKVGEKIAAFPFTTSLAALEFGKKQNDSLLRDNTWLQPIAEAAACIWGTPYGCAASSAYLTRLNGGTIQQALIAGAVTYVSSVAYGEVNTGNWATNALATGAIGGTASSLTGGTFWRGFEFAAGASIAGSIYAHYTNQDPQWGPGENRPDIGALPDQVSSNWYALVDGQIPDSFGNGNLLGLDRALTGNFWDDFFVQSGPLSSVLDQVPSLQAVSMIHDIWNPNWFTNVPLMFPAAGITWGALLNNYWLVPGYNATRH